ncbi:MAG: hypothetical protein ACKVH8_16600, partial [Pirellulales bacterium]
LVTQGYQKATSLLGRSSKASSRPLMSQISPMKTKLKQMPHVNAAFVETVNGDCLSVISHVSDSIQLFVWSI